MEKLSIVVALKICSYLINICIISWNFQEEIFSNISFMKLERKAQVWHFQIQVKSIWQVIDLNAIPILLQYWDAFEYSQEYYVVA